MGGWSGFVISGKELWENHDFIKEKKGVKGDKIQLPLRNLIKGKSAWHGRKPLLKINFIFNSF